MEKVRFGLIGYGKVAHVHAQALGGAIGAELVSVCGRNAGRRDAFAQQYQISSRESVTDMVNFDHVDAVIITTPHPLHHQHALEAFDAGCHVLVEKPMAMNVQQCDEMIGAAERAGKVLSVVSQRRWFPSSMRIRDAIDSGKLGEPMIGQVTILGWRDEEYYSSDPWRGKWDTEGGGILINQAPHQLDLLHWYLGPVSRVYGEWDNVNHPYIEVEDTAVATVRFESGAIASILVSNSQKPGIYAKVHVHGTSGASVGVQTDKGMMFVAGQEGIPEPPINDIWSIEGEESFGRIYEDQDRAFFSTIDAGTYFFSRQIEDFMNAIVQGTKPLVSGEDGRETVKLIEGIYSSGRVHQPFDIS